MGIGFGGSFEWVVRPFEKRDAALQRFIDSRPPEADQGDANIRWGKKSTFGFGVAGGFVIAPNVNVIYPPDEEDEDPQQPPRQHNTVAIDTEDVRVENPDDSSQYLIEQRIKSIVFSNPDGTMDQYNIDWDAPPVSSL